MILLQKKNYFLCTADAEDDDASDLTGDSRSDEVVPGVTQGDPCFDQEWPHLVSSRGYISSWHTIGETISI